MISARGPGDRASASGAEDRWFKSSRAYHKINPLQKIITRKENIPHPIPHKKAGYRILPTIIKSSNISDTGMTDPPPMA